MCHHLREKERRLRKVDDNLHLKVQPYTGIPHSRYQRGMTDIVYAWEHRHGPEVELGSQMSQQLDEYPWCCDQAEGQHFPLVNVEDSCWVLQRKLRTFL